MIMEFYATTVIVVSLAAATFLLIAGYARSNNGRPPHPPSWPIIGHLHLLKEKKPIHRILASLSQKYGSIIHLQLGFRSVLIISSSDLRKECFTSNDRALASRPQTTATKHLGYDNKVFTGLPYNSLLQNIRKICVMKIFSASRIDSSKYLRTEEVSALIRALFENSSAPVNMKSRLSDLTSNIIMHMVASKRVSGGPHRLEDLEEGRELKKMVQETFYLYGVLAVGDYLPFLKWLDPLGSISAMKRLQKKRDAFMQKLVNEHRQKQGMQLRAQDLIDLLISAVDNNEIQSDSDDDVVKATALV